MTIIVDSKIELFSQMFVGTVFISVLMEVTETPDGNYLDG